MHRPLSAALALVLAAASAIACVDEPPTTYTYCFEDSNCGASETCVADLSSGVAYCAGLCERESDCPAHQTCQLGTPARAQPPELRVCVDRVRECTDTELCNGLDDDCDGTIDGAACQPVTGCLDDLPCGGFVCGAPPNQPLALCMPAVEAALADYESCTRDDQCRNGVCQTGRCAPLCRPESSGVRTCPNGKVCARGVGGTLRPELNQCQFPCLDDGECTTEGDRCLWRSVYQDEQDHHSVCGRPDAARKPLGEGCLRNDNVNDETCQSGLCFGQICTRLCAGAGTDCGDVSPTAQCCPTQLVYGVSEFARFVCVEGSCQ